MTCVNTTNLGAYLLGALEPRERFEFEAHLAGCETCRGELVRLAPLPGMLNQLTLADFEATVAADAPRGRAPALFDESPPTAPMAGLPVADEPPDPVLSLPLPEIPPVPPASSSAEPLAAAGEAERAGKVSPLRRRSIKVAAAAAVVLLIAIGGIFGWQALHEPAPPPNGVTWTATAPGSGVSADARMIDREWGTEIELKMRNLPPDRKCYLMVYDHYGNREIAGWWGTDHDPNEEIPASTSIRRSKIDHMEFLLDDRSVALTMPAP